MKVNGTLEIGFHQRQNQQTIGKYSETKHMN